MQVEARVTLDRVVRQRARRPEPERHRDGRGARRELLLGREQGDAGQGPGERTQRRHRLHGGDTAARDDDMRRLMSHARTVRPGRGVPSVVSATGVAGRAGSRAVRGVSHRNLPGISDEKLTLAAQNWVHASRLPRARRARRRVMGTVASLDIRGGRTDALEPAMRSLHDADRRFSTYRADSEINLLLAASCARSTSRQTRGRCSIGVNNCATRRAATSTRARAGGLTLRRSSRAGRCSAPLTCCVAGGLTDFCLSVGGDVITRGSALARDGWTVGVQHPHDRSAVAGSGSTRSTWRSQPPARTSVVRTS